MSLKESSAIKIEEKDSGIVEPKVAKVGRVQMHTISTRHATSSRLSMDYERT